MLHTAILIASEPSAGDNLTVISMILATVIRTGTGLPRIICGGPFLTIRELRPYCDAGTGKTRVRCILRVYYSAIWSSCPERNVDIALLFI